MKTLISVLLLFVCLLSSVDCESRDRHAHNRNRLHLDFVKRQHQNKIRQQHAQQGHRKGENKIFQNQSLKPSKPLFHDVCNFAIKLCN